MKYLYIPTTTLNFNNILSTGSISPAAVYGARRFGYSKFEVVPPNPFQNALLLYDRYPVYSIDDADRDNHPVVIRIRVDRIFDGYQAARDINVYDKTIYLDPASTEFLFANSEAKKIALIKTEPSLTTKLVSIYQPCMKIVGDHAQFDSFKWSKELLDNYSDASREAALKNCESDMRINRLKGFACGYILGAYKSIDGEGAGFRSNLKIQRNKISAMLNDPSRSNSDFLRKALESCSILDQLWSKESGSEEKRGYRRFDPEQGDKIVINDGLVEVLEDRHKYDPQSTLRLKRLFNTYCITSDFAGQLDEVRFKVAYEGAQAIKTLMGGEWENSSNQAYINDLLNNIKSGSPFEFNSSSSLAIKSFAAFVQKGDDLDKLETFLVDQGIGDFRIAFALWGAMFGFSKIPKTIYNLPDLHGDTSYMKKMHNYVHSVVHGIPLRDLEEKPSQVKRSVISTEAQVGEHPLEVIEKFQEQFPGPGAGSLVPLLTNLLEDCGSICKDFFEKLGNVKFSRKKDIPTKKDVVSFFKGTLQSQAELSEQPPLLVIEHQILNLWDDPQAFEIIRDSVPNNLQFHIKRDLEWFIKEWKDPFSRYYGWKSTEAKSPIRKKSLDMRTNAEAIDYYRKHLEKYHFRECIEVKEFLTGGIINSFCRFLSNKYR